MKEKANTVCETCGVELATARKRIVDGKKRTRFCSDACRRQMRVQMLDYGYCWLGWHINDRYPAFSTCSECTSARVRNPGGKGGGDRAGRAASGSGCVGCGGGIRPASFSKTVQRIPGGLQVACVECREKHARDGRQPCRLCGLFLPMSEFHLSRKERGDRWVCCRACMSARKLGITGDRYREMLVEQGGKCPICTIDLSRECRKTDLDHCHATGRVRGLLCSACNRMLGFARDSVPTLLSAVEYLKANGIKE